MNFQKRQARLEWRQIRFVMEGVVAEEVWISLTSRERAILKDALSAYFGGEAAKPNEAAALLRKIAQAKPLHDVTVRVQGGFVEDIEGNPFPVRIYDYDSIDIEEPDRDEQGRLCVVSEFAPDRRQSA